MADLIEKLEGLLELEKKATPGPWRGKRNGSGISLYSDRHFMARFNQNGYAEDHLPVGEHDADLCAQARNILPELLRVAIAAQKYRTIWEADYHTPELRTALAALESKMEGVSRG